MPRASAGDAYSPGPALGIACLQLVLGIAPVRRLRRQLDEVAHLAQAAVDPLAHPVAKHLRLGRRLQLLRASITSRGSHALPLGSQRIVRREQGGHPCVVAARDQLIQRVELELAAPPLAELVNRQDFHVAERTDDLPSAFPVLEASPDCRVEQRDLHVTGLDARLQCEVRQGGGEQVRLSRAHGTLQNEALPRLFGDVAVRESLSDVPGAVLSWDAWLVVVEVRVGQHAGDLRTPEELKPMRQQAAAARHQHFVGSRPYFRAEGFLACLVGVTPSAADGTKARAIAQPRRGPISPPLPQIAISAARAAGRRALARRFHAALFTRTRARRVCFSAPPLAEIGAPPGEPAPTLARPARGCGIGPP